MSQNTLYDIYSKKSFALAHTMVIHNTMVAKDTNRVIEAKGYYVNHSNPLTWKYYLNLAGEYHQADKDIISKINPDGHPYMRIKVAGDNKPEEVDFTKELVSGKNGDYSLSAEYSFGSIYYDELVRKYPNCETLILGILNPIDIDIAINSEDGDILYCGGYYRTLLPTLKEQYGFIKRSDVIIDSEFLIEDWEEDLIYNLQSYIKDYFRRWVIPDFQANHTYFTATMMAGLYGGLINEILKFRINNILTYSAHSYHVREYLTGKGIKGEYVDALTRQQQMYLYFNINWLNANKGKEKTIKAIVDNLLTPSQIPLIYYTLSHDTRYMGTFNYQPLTIFNKNEMNLPIEDSTVPVSVKEMIIKEGNIARDNELFIDEQVDRVVYNSNSSPFNHLTTKVYESEFNELSNERFFSLDDFQFNQWLYAVSLGTYRGSIFITHPNSGSRLQLTPTTAMILLIYSMYRYYFDIHIEEFPELIARMIPKVKGIKVENGRPYPANEELTEYSISPYLSSKRVKEVSNNKMINHRFTSTTDFNTKTTEMFDILEKRLSIAWSETDLYVNGEMEVIANKYYHPLVKIKPLINIPYSDWLNNLGIEIEKIDNETFGKMVLELMVAGTGKSTKMIRSGSDMHKAIIEILKHFMSYTTQIVSKYNRINSKIFDFKGLRISPIKKFYKSRWDMDLILISIEDSTNKMKTRFNIDIGINDISFDSRLKNKAFYSLIDLIPNDVNNRSKTVFDFNFIGFSAFPNMEPSNPTLPYDDILVEEPITENLNDINLVYGQAIGVELRGLSVTVLDTFGLDEVQIEDFIIDIE